jgi:hypothetical protein
MPHARDAELQPGRKANIVIVSMEFVQELGVDEIHRQSECNHRQQQ